MKTRTYRPPRRRLVLEAERDEIRNAPELLMLERELHAVQRATGQLRRYCNRSPLRGRSLGADTLLGEVENNLRNAGQFVRLAVEAAEGRGPFARVTR